MALEQPYDGYDEQSVEEILAEVDEREMSENELTNLLTYEITNKDRVTLVEELESQLDEEARENAELSAQELINQEYADQQEEPEDLPDDAESMVKPGPGVDEEEAELQADENPQRVATDEESSREAEEQTATQAYADTENEAATTQNAPNPAEATSEEVSAEEASADGEESAESQPATIQELPSPRDANAPEKVNIVVYEPGHVAGHVYDEAGAYRAEYSLRLKQAIEAKTNTVALHDSDPLAEQFVGGR